MPNDSTPTKQPSKPAATASEASTKADRIRRVGFVATRISGTDGVSLEVAKWATIFERMGYECYYIAGHLDRPRDRSRLIPEAHFKHPVIAEINRQCFGQRRRSRDMSAKLREMTCLIKEKLYDAIGDFKLDLIVAQNCVTIPMNIPLGAALVETLLETGLPCIAHHHDFVWERERYLVNAVRDYLRQAFPPPFAEIQHVVINSVAGEEFSRRTGLAFRIIPNCMDFANPPAPPDPYALDFRQTLGLADDDIIIMQPTRVVERKGIENSVELVRRLDDPRCKLLITHSSEDEGEQYVRRIRDYAQLLGVEVIFAQPWISSERGEGPDGQKRYSIWDVYPHADLVTYPSTYEGFGNAFLEAIYYRKPILCNRYAIYRTDIEPCGMRAVTMDGYLTDEVVEQVRRVLTDDDYRMQLVENNYQVGCQFFSFERVQDELRSILSQPQICH